MLVTKPEEVAKSSICRPQRLRQRIGMEMCLQLLLSDDEDRGMRGQSQEEGKTHWQHIPGLSQKTRPSTFDGMCIATNSTLFMSERTACPATAISPQSHSLKTNS